MKRIRACKHESKIQMKTRTSERGGDLQGICGPCDSSGHGFHCRFCNGVVDEIGDVGHEEDQWHTVVNGEADACQDDQVVDARVQWKAKVSICWHEV